MSEDGQNRLTRALKRLDGDPRLVKLVRLGRSRLPGDDRYGDPLSLTGDQAPAVLGRRLSALTAERPGALREVGMSALQVWQGVSEAQGRGRGDRELTIVFTDLADFSTWALDAGDTQALALLRDVGEAVEPEICSRRGEIVKRLGDDYFGVDVNVAARVAEAAGAGEVLISEAVHSKVEGGDTVQLKRRWRFSAKGAPKGLKVYAAEPS